MKVCPNCGKVVGYNSYFGAYICDNCGWEANENLSACDSSLIEDLKSLCHNKGISCDEKLIFEKFIDFLKSDAQQSMNSEV